MKMLTTGTLLGFPYRGLAKGALSVGLLAFALPFASVSCGGPETVTIRGVNAVIGSHGTPGTYAGDWAFQLALLGAAIALICQFLIVPLRPRVVASAVASVCSVILMLLGQTHVNAQVATFQSQVHMTIKWEIGFWVALVAFGVGAVAAAVEFLFVVLRPSSGASAVRMETLSPRSRTAIQGGVLAIIASLMVLAACTLPYIHSTGTFGNPPPSVFNPEWGQINWVAAEPVGVALLAFVAGVVLVKQMSQVGRAIAAGMLLALGLQTFLFFVPYVTQTIGVQRDLVGPGGVVGLLAGLFLFVGGLVPALDMFARDSAPAT
jgi:hypothetical protein